MSIWTVVGGIALCVAAGAALYGLHRLALWLETRGLLYYWHRKPEGGSAASCLAELQRTFEPNAQHVYRVREEKRPRAEHEGEGEGGQPPS